MLIQVSHRFPKPATRLKARRVRRGAMIPSVMIALGLLTLVTATLLEEHKRTSEVEHIRSLSAQAARLIKRMDQAVHLDRSDPTSVLSTLSKPTGWSTLDLTLRHTNVRADHDPSEWWGANIYHWQEGPSIRFIGMRVPKYDVPVAVALVDFSAVREGLRLDARRVLEAYALKTQDQFNDLRILYASTTGDTLEASEAVYLTHWFSGLNEDFIFRQGRPRDTPNVMLTDLNVQGNIRSIEKLQANIFTTTDATAEFKLGAASTETLKGKPQTDPVTGATLTTLSPIDVSLSGNVLANSVTARRGVVNNELSLAETKAEIATTLTVTGDVTLVKKGTATSPSSSAPTGLTGAKTEAAYALKTKDISASRTIKMQNLEITGKADPSVTANNLDTTISNTLIDRPREFHRFLKCCEQANDNAEETDEFKHIECWSRGVPGMLNPLAVLKQVKRPHHAKPSRFGGLGQYPWLSCLCSPLCRWTIPLIA